MFCLKVYCVTIILMGVAFLVPINAKSPVIFCYVGSWANYRTGDGKFLIEHIDPNLCTHLVYLLAKLNGDNTIASYDPYLDLEENWGLGAYKRFNMLKKLNPNLKTLISIGGWNEGSTKYSNMASSQASRVTFSKSVITFLSEHGFDGLDICWEYPANRGGVPEDKENFVLLLKELRYAFGARFLLTIAASAGKATMDTAYDVQGLSKYVDYINVMAYDFHGSWESFTGLSAPLYKSDDEPEEMQVLNVDYAIQYWLDHGAPSYKLVLGIGLYGRSFTLKDANNNGIYEYTTEPGPAGPITKEPGMLGYNEICRFIKFNGWTEKWHDVYKAPYAYSGTQWVGYDNEKSIKLKIDYLKQKQLAGAMVWSLATDDFKGKCGEVKYPLLTTIKNSLGVETEPSLTVGSTNVPTSIPQPTSTTSDMATSTSDSVCRNFTSCLLRDPNNCAIFYVCNEESDAIRLQCPPGTKFDLGILECNFSHLVTDC